MSNSLASKETTTERERERECVCETYLNMDVHCILIFGYGSH